MVEARERIRLEGKPISRDLFAKYFLEVYDTISKSDEVILIIIDYHLTYFFLHISNFKAILLKLPKFKSNKKF